MGNAHTVLKQTTVYTNFPYKECVTLYVFTGVLHVERQIRHNYALVVAVVNNHNVLNNRHDNVLRVYSVFPRTLRREHSQVHFQEPS